MPRPIQTAAGMSSATPIAVNTTLSFVHQSPHGNERSGSVRASTRHAPAASEARKNMISID
jgi:hypothetical protein